MMENGLIEFGGSMRTMSSLEIAEATGKPHNDVMKAIRKMEPAWFKVNGGNFSRVEYRDAKGEMRPAFALTKTECLYVATKFNDEARARLVLRWEELERKERAGLVSLPDFSNPADAARAWAEQYEQKLLVQKRADEAEQQVSVLTKAIEQMQPKVSYYDLILNNPSTMTMTQIAQDYGMSAKALNKILQDLKVQYKVNGQWILYARFVNQGQGYVLSKPVEIITTSGQRKVKWNTEWTQKGRLFLYEGLKNHGILPLIEQETFNV